MNSVGRWVGGWVGGWVVHLPVIVFTKGRGLVHNAGTRVSRHVVIHDHLKRARLRKVSKVGKHGCVGLAIESRALESLSNLLKVVGLFCLFGWVGGWVGE